MIAQIIEEKDASQSQTEIDEINTGVYLFDLKVLRQVISKLESNNAQKELYLTDVISLINKNGGLISAIVSNDYTETLGINDRSQLAECAAIMRDRINHQHMLAGVTIIDPTTTWIDTQVKISPDVVIHPGSALSGKTIVGDKAIIGPRTTLVDCEVGSDATVVESFATKSKIGASVQVGPYTYLREGTVLDNESELARSN